MPDRLLFVCSGNTCRSPLAEALARQAIAERGIPDIEVASAGSSAWDGAPASDGALLVGMERGLDLGAHRSRQLTRDMVEEADLILAMSTHHRDAVASLGGAGKVHLLTAYAARASEGEGVADPFGSDLEAYRATAEELDREVRRVIARYAEERSSQGKP